MIEGIKTFLKKPNIKSEEKGLSSLQIIRKGVEDFQKLYSNKIYSDGTNAKLAIYCGTIDRLENEVYPFLTGDLGIDSNKILKFHKGNKEHPQPQDSELDFKLLDEPVSRKEIILLVQIGKEGWDCRSLTSVILSQAKDCPKNMVLQTSCRCLRQVEKDATETALIWLSKDNADTLNKQLAEKQKTSINEINSLGVIRETEKVERYSRIEYLKLPKVDFFQLKVEYDTITINGESNPKKEIVSINTDSFLNQAIITQRNLQNADDITRTILDTEKGDYADFNRWLFQISKESFGILTLSKLKQFEGELEVIFKRISFIDKDERFFNDFYDLAEINKQIRLAFHTKRELETKSEIIPQSAKMLIVESLKAIAKNPKLYPSEAEIKEILEIDREGLSIEDKIKQQKEKYEKAIEVLKEQGLDNFLPGMPEDLSPAVKCKDKTFHFLPYKFDSGLEKNIFEEALRDNYLKDCNLEIYFNGEKDITDFRILCYTENKKYLGRYTPDFMIIQRKDEKIHRALIVETKGSGFAEQKAFVLRRKFVETEFLKINNGKFGYKKFDYLYLTDADTLPDNLIKFNTKLKTFFCD